MKRLIIIALLAAGALTAPILASAQCGISPFMNGACPILCDESGASEWCDPQSPTSGGYQCVATIDCIGYYCAGTSQGQCGGGTPYCYADSPKRVSCHASAKVDLLDFSAEGTAEGVKLAWTTGQEIDCGVFKILRCETSARDVCELWNHSELNLTIPCEDDPDGADYFVVDMNVEKQKSYSYYLREYDTTDRVFEYGPLFMAVDQPITSTGSIEPFESTFEILTAQPADDDDDEEDAKDKENVYEDDSDDDNAACGKL